MITAISLKDAKERYPTARIFEILTDRFTSSEINFINLAFLNTKSKSLGKILFVCAQRVIAYVDFDNFVNTGGFLQKKLYSVHWYTSEFALNAIEKITFVSLNKYFDKLRKRYTEEIDSLVMNIIGKYRAAEDRCNFVYKFSADISDFIYLKVIAELKESLLNVKLDPLFENNKITELKITKKHPLDRKTILNAFQKKILHNCDENISPKDIPSFLGKLPDSTRVIREVPIYTFASKIQAADSIFLTIFFFLSKIVWLNKISVASLPGTQKGKCDEIHFFLLEMRWPPGNKTRMIKGQKFSCYYCAEGEFVNELELIKYFDKIIPYQTVFVVKLDLEPNPIYRIFQGRKKFFANSVSKPDYISNEWAFEREIAPFVLKGNECGEILKNLRLQISGVDGPAIQSEKSTFDETLAEIMKFIDSDSLQNGKSKLEKNKLAVLKISDKVNVKGLYSRYYTLAQSCARFIMNNLRGDVFVYTYKKQLYLDELAWMKRTQSKVLLEESASYSEPDAAFVTVWDTNRFILKSFLDAFVEVFDIVYTDEKITFTRKDEQFIDVNCLKQYYYDFTGNDMIPIISKAERELQKKIKKAKRKNLKNK